VSIDFHRLIKAIHNNRLIIIDYIDYIDCLPILFFKLGRREMSSKLGNSALISITFTHHHDPKENFPCLVVLLEILFYYQGS